MKLYLSKSKSDPPMLHKCLIYMHITKNGIVHSHNSFNYANIWIYIYQINTFIYSFTPISLSKCLVSLTKQVLFKQ